MKKQVIVDLIKAYYEDDPRLFFRRTIDILKEFKEDGDDELVKYLDFIIKSKVKIMPKRESTPFEPEISWEEADKLGWTLTLQDIKTNQEDIDFIRKQEEIKKELGFSLEDFMHTSADAEKIFGTEVYTIPEEPKNSGYVAVDYTREGTVVCRSTNDPKEAITAKELKKLFK